MCADIYTKAFSEDHKWVHACDLINIIHPNRLRARFRQHEEYMGKGTIVDGANQPSTASPPAFPVGGYPRRQTPRCAGPAGRR